MRSMNRVSILPRCATVLVCALMLLVPLYAQTPPPPPSITFAATAVAANDSWTEMTTANSSVDMAVFDSYRQTHAEKLEIDTVVTKTKSVVTASPSGIDVLDISYATVTAAGVSLPSAGKNYRVTMQGQTMLVAYSDSASLPSADEIAFVQDDNPQIDQFWTFNKIFGGKTVVKGAVISVQKAFAEEFVNAQDGMVVDQLTLTLHDITGEGSARQAVFHAVLDMHSNIKSNEKPTDETREKSKFAGRIDIAMTGEVIVKQDCRPVKVAFEGTNTVTAKKGAFDPGELPDDQLGAGKEMRVGGAEGTMSFGTDFSY